MGKLTSFSFFLFFFHFQLHYSSSSAKTCHPNESSALLNFKDIVLGDDDDYFCSNTEHLYPLKNTWVEGTNCCSWDGVTCHPSTGHVIGLDLSCRALRGTITPNNTFFLLSHLQRLNLAQTGLSGSIPSEFGSFSKLTHLNLSLCFFSGKIPPEISHLSKLVSLDLSLNSEYNYDTESDYFLEFENHGFEKFSRNLTKLSFLDLRTVNMSLVAPKTLLNLSSSLKSLYLSRCFLAGNLPSDFSRFQSLQVLDLYYNLDLLINISKANWFASLKVLDLHETGLYGEITYSVSNFKSLEYLDLSLNELFGSIPESLGSLNSLKYLDLSNNDLFSSVPATFGNLKSLKYLDLSFNNFLSSIPKSLVNLSNLKCLDASFTNLSGSIPASLGNLRSLEYLDLSFSNFSGLIPASLGNLKQLKSLALKSNHVVGQIPGTLEIFAKDSSLVYFNANGNNLEGPLPRSLVNCCKLQVLDLGNNKINGIFPNWLENLPELQILILKSNKFHGTIGNPLTASPFRQLQILDLSQNEFTGVLPRKYLQYMKYLMKVNKGKLERKYAGDSSYYFQDSLGVELIMKGQEFEMKEILTIFTAIDFSSNKFQGEIPKEVGLLKSLIVLNFSHNGLTGHIPLSLGNLAELESLDLSFNKLVGEIPQQLVVLTFLAVLNLSYNRLEGHIPEGNQFSTFSNDSYVGNFGLCGFPMSKKCNNGKLPEPIFHEDEEEAQDSKGWFDWKIALMGYGCGLVFGLSIGYIVFATGKPQWFVRMVEGHQYQRLRRRNLRGRRRSNP
ncbi:hypothetical protein JCGZ_20321 [Jatropha curcas]|uniref:Disease resistance R13L4/SHOC-2-like LRR domain-containing protein n=1 Tax=Jatropha curcas TaxID=180498 RepID=A0A067JT68_JATCU|nr:hypothetical protein JCGZ_20321 [Jatropha curcas]